MEGKENQPAKLRRAKKGRRRVPEGSVTMLRGHGLQLPWNVKE